jgi:hypothetical protein
LLRRLDVRRGGPAFGVDIRYELLPAAIVTLVLGGLTFTALGFAVASFVRGFSRAATDEEGGVKRSWPWRRMLTE